MISVHVPSVEDDGGEITFFVSDHDGRLRAEVTDASGDARSVVVETADLARAVRALLAAQVDPAGRETGRAALDNGAPVAPPVTHQAPPVEPWRVKRATRDVIRNLCRDGDDRHTETMGDRLARGVEYADFVRSAKAWLGDATNLTSKTINSADYQEVWETFNAPDLTKLI